MIIPFVRKSSELHQRDKLYDLLKQKREGINKYMNSKKRNAYITDLESKYENSFKKSLQTYNKGKDYFPNGVPQSGRFLKPFPPYIIQARGTTVTTIDGYDLVDYWQGHFSNLLGHNPPLLIDALKESFDKGIGLQLGMFTEFEEEFASLMLRLINMDSILFSTSGALSTMYSTWLGLSYTGRNKVLKVSGGWQGIQPWALKGVRFLNGIEKVEIECAGISDIFDSEVLSIPFNDTEKLVDCFQKHGEDIGVFILELVLGNSGMIVADKEFVQKARELTTKYGAILIVDEIVTGFRVNAGGLYKYFGIEPDIVVFGKAISGGMPFVCFAGKKEVFLHASTSMNPRVWADGGTFTAHPATLIAAIKMVTFLSEHKDKIYPQILKNMTYLRQNVKKIFEDNNIPVDVTGTSQNDDIPHFPIGTVRFLLDAESYDKKDSLYPLYHWDATKVDIQFRDHISKIALMLKGLYTWQGLGVMTFKHSEDDIKKALIAYSEFASEIKDLF